MQENVYCRQQDQIWKRSIRNWFGAWRNFAGRSGLRKESADRRCRIFTGCGCTRSRHRLPLCNWCCNPQIRVQCTGEPLGRRKTVSYTHLNTQACLYFWTSCFNLSCLFIKNTPLCKQDLQCLNFGLIIARKKSDNKAVHKVLRNIWTFF